MNADVDLSSGLTGVAVGTLIRRLRDAEPKNPVAWFCVFHVLLRLQREWEDDAMEIARLDDINQALLEPIKRVLSSMEVAHPNFHADLRSLVISYRALFF